MKFLTRKTVKKEVEIDLFSTPEEEWPEKAKESLRTIKIQPPMETDKFNALPKEVMWRWLCNRIVDRQRADQELTPYMKESNDV